MSNGPFAVAAVTAVLKDLLNNGLADHNLSDIGNVSITALPPDRIPTGAADEKSQINLFMYQATPNQGWRNVGFPARDASGERIGNPPLALNLHYLVTAYGEKEFHAETLLGYAMQLLHDYPILTRAMINATLKPALPPEVTLPPGLAMLSTSGLANQVEQIKIIPQTISTEEMSRLWSAMQAKYRPTAAYQVSVVLIDSDKASRSPLPVLSQGPSALAGLVPPFPEILSLTMPKNQIAALPGDTLVVRGHDFAGDSGNPAQVTLVGRLSSSRLTTPRLLTVPAANRSARQVSFSVPNNPANFPAGVYSLALVVTPNGKPDEARTSNEMPLQVTPRITSDLTVPVARTGIGADGLGTATLNLKVSPQVLPTQSASLILGSQDVPAATHANQTDTLTFVVGSVAAGTYRVRLRVDGVESLLVDRSDPDNPKFDDTQQITLT